MPERTRPARLVAVAAAAVLLLAACGPATATPAPPAAPAVAASSAMPDMSMSPSTADTADSAPVATNTVSIKNFVFSPATVTVKVGTTVAWTNQDTEPHTVTDKAGAFHSEAMNTGDTYRFTFTKPGTYDYLCTIHPFMVATVVVTP